MKWLIYLFSFLSINLVANQIAMKKLLAVTGWGNLSKSL